MKVPFPMLAMAISLSVHLILMYCLGVYENFLVSSFSHLVDSQKKLSVHIISKSTKLETSLHAQRAFDDSPGSTGSSRQLSNQAIELLHTGPDAPSSILMRNDMHYFEIVELTEKPILTQDISPILSLALPEAKPGLFTMQLLINELGEIDDVIINERYIEKSIQELLLQAFKTAKFKPGEIDTIPVKSRLIIEVKLDEIMPE